eukprot:158997-Rhodomonas_salina.2
MLLCSLCLSPSRPRPTCSIVTSVPGLSCVGGMGWRPGTPGGALRLQCRSPCWVSASAGIVAGLPGQWVPLWCPRCTWCAFCSGLAMPPFRTLSPPLLPSSP